MIDGDNLLIVSVGLVLAGVVKGATGIGYATFALPILANIVGLKPAMALVVAPTLAANMSLALTGGLLRETARAFATVYLAMIPGVAAGAAALCLIEQRAASMLLGASMLAYAMLTIARPTLTMSATAVRLLRVPIGFTSGFLTGLTGSQVIPLVPYMMAAPLSTAQMLQAINIGVLILSTMLGASLFATEAVDPMLQVASLAAVIPALVGSAIGSSLQSRIGGMTARRLVLAVVGLSGLRMLLG